MRVTLVGLVLLFAFGCAADEDFVGVDGEPITAIAIAEDTPPYFSSEDTGALYLVETRIPFELDAPTGGDISRLTNEAAEMDPPLPFERVPWVRRGDLIVEIDWAVRNLTDSDVRAAVVLNGFNEFHEYMPGFTVDDDEVILDFAQWERDLELEPFETRTGTIRTEEMDEVMTDLATVVNGVPNPNMVVYFESQSAIDPRVQPYIPEIIPGLTGVRMGLRAMGLPIPDAPTAGKGVLVLEVSVHVRDERGRLVDEGEDPWELPQPAAFMPSMAAAP